MIVPPDDELRPAGLGTGVIAWKAAREAAWK